MGPYHYARYLLSTRGPLLTFRLHRFVYRLSGGRLLPTSGSRMPVLLLTTTGRKTGQARTWPLNYYPDPLSDGPGVVRRVVVEQVVVVASNRGQPTYPQWYLNLRANPRATIQRGAKRVAVTAREATPEEANRLWPTLTRLEPLYLRYRPMTDRPFPLVYLTRDHSLGEEREAQ
jgi:deazaflavin-dependent oxidoreductase (nitroreductase family)